MNHFDKLENQRKAQKKYYAEKCNRQLKYAALASIGISIILMLIMIFGMDHLSVTMLLLLRGFTGFFAIIFVALVAILVYRVNVSYSKDRLNKKIHNNNKSH